MTTRSSRDRNLRAGEVAGTPMIGRSQGFLCVRFYSRLREMQTFLPRNVADTERPAFFSSADFCRRRRQTARRLRRRTQETR